MARKPAAKKPAKPAAASARYSQRADLGAPADAYFAKVKPPALNAVASSLRAIVRAGAPKARESIKWGMPFYELNGMLGYIKARSRYVTLGFYHQGIHLADPDGRLEGTGKSMRHVKVYGPEGVDKKMFTSWVKQAAAINTKA